MHDREQSVPSARIKITADFEERGFLHVGRGLQSSLYLFRCEVLHSPCHLICKADKLRLGELRVSQTEYTVYWLLVA